MESKSNPERKRDTGAEVNREAADRQRLYFVGADTHHAERWPSVAGRQESDRSTTGWQQGDREPRTVGEVGQRSHPMAGSPATETYNAAGNTTIRAGSWNWRGSYSGTIGCSGRQDSRDPTAKVRPSGSKVCQTLNASGSLARVELATVCTPISQYSKHSGTAPSGPGNAQKLVYEVQWRHRAARTANVRERTGDRQTAALQANLSAVPTP